MGGSLKIPIFRGWVPEKPIDRGELLQKGGDLDSLQIWGQGGLAKR